MRSGLAKALATVALVALALVNGSVRAAAVTVSYTEQAAAVALLASPTVTSGTYDGGYIEFAATSSTASETLGFETVGTPLTGSGQVSIVGTSVYLGNGSTADNIGSIDSTLDGESGTALRINFVNTFSNASFEEPTLTGWTKVEDQIVLGTTSIAGFQSVDPRNYSGMGCANDGDDDVYTGSAVTWTRKTVSLTTADASDGTKSLLLDMYAVAGTSGGWVIHGPAVYSDPFQATAGDAISFDWKAIGGGDDYSVVGYILNTADGAQTTVLDAYTSRDGAVSSFTSASAVIPTTGTYRFVFVAGSHNEDCGRQGDAKLYIDNVQVFGSKVSAAVAANVAKLVTYENSSDTPSASQTVSFKTKTGSGSEVTADTITVNIAAVDDAPTFGSSVTESFTNTSADDTFSSASGTLSVSDLDGDSVTCSLPNGTSESAAIGGVTYDEVEVGTYGSLRLKQSTCEYVVVPDDSAIEAETSGITEGFTVRATASGVGVDTTLTLQVLVATSAPGAPTGLSATANGDLQVGVSWTAPTWLGGSAILDYVVEYSSDGTNFSTFADGTSTASTADVTGLTLGTTYTFRVKATNSTGTGAASSTATAVAVTLPGTPSSLAGSASSSSATLTWTAPSDGGSAITGYEYSLDGGSTWTSTGSSAASATISSLSASTAYTVELRAVNAVGESATPASLSFTTSAAPAAPAPTPTAPTAPAPTPTVPLPVPSGPEPVFVSEGDAPLLERQPGTSGAILNGVPIDTRQSAGDRTVIQRFIAGQPAGASNPVTVNGDNQLPSLITDDDDNPVPIPDTNIVIVETDTTALAIAAQRSDGQPGVIRSDGALVVDRGRVGTAGYGFTPSRVGEIVLFSEPQLVGTFTTDASGAFTAQFDLPADLEPGPHTIVLTLGNETKAVGIYIEADTPTVTTPTRATLPVTGDTTPINWIILTLTLGAWTLLATRRRTSV
jgi:hypothetical protein